MHIQKAIDFLRREQRPDGGFWCLVSKKFDDYAYAGKVPAIVPTNIILSSLSDVDGAKDIKKKSADFLLKQKGPFWSFNYWFRDSDWFVKEPYPDDTDDTFCALAALSEYNPDVFDGSVMAKITAMLSSAEKSEGGPYDMWLVPAENRDTWNDTDLVCNANIAYFLFLHGIELPNVTAFIEKKIEENGYEFPYNTVFPAIYFISRCYRGKKVKNIIDILLKQERQNPLRTALAISSLINFSGATHKNFLEKMVTYLLDTQCPDGSWPPASFYFQSRLEHKTLYAGSAEITTALCIEALAKFEKLKTAGPVKALGSGEVIFRKIEKIVKDRFPKNLKNDADPIIAKILKDKHIALLPYMFAQSLEKDISEELTARLGAATVFGWIAYDIYDDLLDDEGKPNLLPVANISLRQSAEMFGKLLPEKFSKHIFDRIDTANHWETTRHQFKNFSQLAEKSLGHVLGPAAVLFASGAWTEIGGVMKFFRHYLIARQLNDDAHDWEEDLDRGHVNAVAEMILKEKSGSDLRKIFWQKTVVQACNLISKHIKLAYLQLEKLSIIKNKDILESLLQPIERSVDKALQDRRETLAFLETYG